MAADNQEYYGYYYDTEEDRGLLDPAWERQQRKVLSSLHGCSYSVVTSNQLALLVRINELWCIA